MGLLKKRLNDIENNVPQKRAFFRFFDIYFRKFWHFGKANLLYTAALIPTFLIAFLFMFIPANIIVGAEGSGFDAIFVTIIGINLYISLWGMGPATAGITYIMRNYAREEHAWLWSDFKEAFKANFKQALIVFIIDIVVACVFYIAIVVYSQMTGVLGGLKYVIYMLVFLYTMMHFYIYPMMVTFDLKLSDLYKNSLLFAISKVPVNLFIIIVQVFLHTIIPIWSVLYGGTYYVLLLLLVLLLETVLTQGFSSFMVNFSVYPAIKKYMLDVAVHNSEVKSEDKGEI